MKSLSMTENKLYIHNYIKKETNITESLNFIQKKREKCKIQQNVCFFATFFNTQPTVSLNLHARRARIWNNPIMRTSWFVDPPARPRSCCHVFRAPSCHFLRQKTNKTKKINFDLDWPLKSRGNMHRPSFNNILLETENNTNNKISKNST